MIQRPLPVLVPPSPGNRTGPDRRLNPSANLLLIGFAIAVLFLLYYAQYSGSVRWVLGVVGVAVFALFAWSMILRRTSEPPPLVGPPSRDEVQEGDLGFLAAAVRRASRGLSYSQVQVVGRTRAAFVERASLSLGLSLEAMAAVQRDPAELHRILDDPVLERFVRMDVGDLDDRSRWVRETRAGDGFATEFQEVLARMEAWR